MVYGIKTSERGLRYFEENGTTYWELYFQCPVCLQNGLSDVPLRYWVHSSDDCSGNGNARIFIGDNGMYKCESCGHSSVIVLWKYHCPVHEEAGLGTYLSVTNVKTLAKTLSIAGMMVEDAGTQWLIRVLQEIDKQWRDPRYNTSK